MSSSLQQSLRLNRTPPASHERFDVKKKSRKRRNLLNRYGSSKRRKIASPLNRKQAPTKEETTLPNSPAPERFSLSNAVLNTGLNSTFEHDGNHKNIVEDKQVKRADLNICTDSDFNNRVIASSQAAQLDTGDELCSSPMLPTSTRFLQTVSKSTLDKRQSPPDKRVLRPRRRHNKETKENVPPLADSPLIVGRRIEVYWPLDSAWYRGLISAYDNVRKKHKVSYDDGEEEWLYLAQETFKYEMPSKSESVSAGKGLDCEVSRDGKESLTSSALPSSSPHGKLHTNGRRNGSLRPSFRKPTSVSVNITSPQVDATASVLSQEAGFEAKETNLTIQKDTKVFIRRHKGNSMGSGKVKSEVDGLVKRAGSFVYERRQRQRLKNRSLVTDIKKNEATKRVKSFKGQHLLGLQKGRNGQKWVVENAQPKGQAGHSCSVESLNTEKMDRCELEDGNMGASVQEKQSMLTNARKRKLRLWNDDTSIAGISKGRDDGAPESSKAGLALHRSSEEHHKWTRRKHKIKSLAHTNFAAEAMKVVGFVVQDKLPPGDGETISPCFDNLPPESSRLNSNPDDLDLGSNKVLERRKSKRGRRYAGGYNRGRGRLIRKIAGNRASRGSSKPSNKHQGTSSGATATKRSASGGDLPQCVGLFSEFAMSLEWKRRLSPQKAFHSTIHSPMPNVASALFTWQLFNMFEAVELSGGKGFGGEFQWKGSARDLANIVLLFMSVVRSIPFSNLQFYQGWQGRVSYDLWTVLSRKEQWSRNLHASLSPEADNLLMQHVSQLLSAHCILNMTSRQMLNIFSSYILKPYIVAILCEKGAQLRVVVQHYLLAPCPLQDGICFERQFVGTMKLRSHAGAEADFVSCLAHLPVAQNQCMGVPKMFENWVASVASVGHSQLPIPVPSFKLHGNQDLQFFTASYGFKETTSHCSHPILCLEQSCSGFGTESWHLGGLVLPKEVGDPLSHGRFSCFYEFRRRMDFYSGLCFDSMLQKWLDSSGSTSVASECVSKTLHIRSDCVTKNKGMSDWDTWEPESGKKRKNDPSRSMQINLNGLKVPAKSNKCNQISLEKSTPVTAKECISPGAFTQLDKDTTSNAFFGCSPLSSINDLAYSASGSSSCSSEEYSTKWKTTKMSDISFRPHDTGDPKGTIGENHYMAAGQHFKKRAGSKRHPNGCEDESFDMKQPNFSCTANLLLSSETSSRREFGVRAELQSRKSAWVVVVQLEGVCYSHKVVESTITSRVNRFTHAMMWKGGEGWILEFCDRMQWLLFKRMHEECGHRNARAAFVKQIPIPFVKQIEASSEDWPSHTLLYGEKWPGEVENALDCTKRVYDMDSEDERWLTSRSQRAEERVSMDIFERIIDKLERVTYLRQGEMVASDEAGELCESMVTEDAVLSIHRYWSEKRSRKDNALIRYFESPLPKKYQKQLDNWKQRMEELECRFSHMSKEELQRQYPQPPLFAFCWPSRGLDADNVSKRLQRQRLQQRHLNALKYVRTSSFDTSEELQRVSLLRSHVHDSEWYMATQRGDYWQRKIARDGFSEHLVMGFQVGSSDYLSIYEAEANAVAARQSAQMYLLRFDSALQRAVSAIIDFEATYIAELTSMSEPATASYEQLLDLRKRIIRVMNQFSSLAGKDDLGGDIDHEDCSDDVDGHEEDDDPSWTVSLHEDGFGNSAFSVKEEGSLLSLSERAHLEAWMRSTLRQRAC